MKNLSVAVIPHRILRISGIRFYITDHPPISSSLAGALHPLRKTKVIKQDLTVRSNSSMSSRLKSRPRHCPYTLVAGGSGAGVIRGRECPHSTVAGRNASEPMSSLVNEVEKPTLCSEGEGRWTRAATTEGVRVDSRGSRNGMVWKTDCPVLETRFRGWGGHRPLGIRQRKRSGPEREAEGFILPFAAQGQHNPGRGKEPCCVQATNERRIRGWPWG